MRTSVTPGLTYTCVGGGVVVKAGYLNGGRGGGAVRTHNTSVAMGLRAGVEAAGVAKVAAGGVVAGGARGGGGGVAARCGANVW